MFDVLSDVVIDVDVNMIAEVDVDDALSVVDADVYVVYVVKVDVVVSSVVVVVLVLSLLSSWWLLLLLLLLELLLLLLLSLLLLLLLLMLGLLL